MNKIKCSSGNKMIYQGRDQHFKTKVPIPNKVDKFNPTQKALFNKTIFLSRYKTTSLQADLSRCRKRQRKKLKRIKAKKKKLSKRRNKVRQRISLKIMASRLLSFQKR